MNCAVCDVLFIEGGFKGIIRPTDKFGLCSKQCVQIWKLMKKVERLANKGKNNERRKHKETI